MAPVSRSAIPDTTTQRISAGGPVFAKPPEPLAVTVDRPTAGVPAAEDVVAATVVLVLPELPVEFVVAGAVLEVAVVLVAVPEPAAIVKGAEKTLGAVKSF
jgi:hypothetical protein